MSVSSRLRPAAMLLSYVALFLSGSGCRFGEAEGAASGKRMTYICTETKEVMTAAPQPTPAVNPKTGRRTLVAALYCSRCRKWYPAPPLDVLQRNPGAALCPKTGEPLSLDGPPVQTDKDE